MTDVSLSDFAISAVIAGVIGGIVGSIPFLSFLNLLCCGIIILTGLLAAFILKKRSGKIDPKNGAIVGVLSGIVYGLVGAIGIFLLQLLLSMIQMSAAVMGPRKALPMLSSGAGGLISGLIAFFVTLFINGVLGVIFGTIGGAIGGKLFE